MNNKSNISIGTDPEFFLFSHDKNRIISAVGLIGGDKYCPRELGDGFSVQEDNVLVEYGVPPSYSEDEFVDNINKANKLVSAILPENTKLACVASNIMQPDELDNMQANTFGCDPDFNCWTKSINPKPRAADGLRSAGGHIHIGFTDSVKSETVNNYVRFMDLFLGVPSVLMDKDTRRKALYGKAGAYRVQPWGLEYRTLSNFWLASDELVRWAYNNAMEAVKMAEEGKINIENYSHEIQRCINDNDKELAKQIVESFKINVYENNVINEAVVC